MPRITCPTCGAALDVTPDMIGETLECGSCQAHFVVTEEGPDRRVRPDDEESWPRQRVKAANTLATISMVLGIGSLFTAAFSAVCCAGVVSSGPLAVMAIVLGAQGMKPGSIKGFAVIGIATGGLALLVLALTVGYVGVNLALNP